MAGIDPFASITGRDPRLADARRRPVPAAGHQSVSRPGRHPAGVVRDPRRLDQRRRRADALPLSQFASLVLTIAFGFTMITYYRAPIPGIGISFTQLLTDQPIYLARQLEATQVQRLSDRLNELYLSMEQPLVFNVSALVGYFLVALAVTAARVALLAVIAFGLVATGVAVLVGPVFIPFFLMPQLDWLFWGWLKSLLQYAFYQVIAQAFVFVFGSFLINFLDAFPPPYTVDRLLVERLPSHLPAVRLYLRLAESPVVDERRCFPAEQGESALPRFFGLTRSMSDAHRSRFRRPATNSARPAAGIVEQYGSTLVMNTYLAARARLPLAGRRSASSS